MLPKNSKIYIAGHKGMVGSAIHSELINQGYSNFVVRTHSELELHRQADVISFMEQERPDVVILAAAKVGGIHANSTYPADFIYDNLLIQCNVIEAAHSVGCQKLLFLGSSCIYPKFADQPMREEALLSGYLEPTNEPYAIAKIAGIKLCESFNAQYARDYRSVMPTNLYGENDNFHPLNSHVIPAMMRRFYEAKTGNQAEVVVWGSGNARREFLHVEDMARACVHVLNLDENRYKTQTAPQMTHLNVGTGIDCTIRELAETMAKVVGFEGKIVFDASKPDGTPRKLLDVSRINALDWRYSIKLEEGLARTYSWFLQHQTELRAT